MGYTSITSVVCGVTIVFATVASTIDMEVFKNADCEDKTYCDIKPVKYDEHQHPIDDIIRKNNKNGWMGFDTTQHEQTGTLYGGDDENCETITSIVKPFLMRVNTSATEAELVVQSRDLTQTIRVTKCKDTGKDCFSEFKKGSYTIKTKCINKFGSVALYIFNPATNTIEYKKFDVPVCCSCSIKNSVGGSY